MGGPPDAAVTCQLLPPGFPGYRPYCPYTVDPDAGGRWKGPDLERAQALVDASGTHGAQVIVGPGLPNFNSLLPYLGSLLEQLGYQVSVETVTSFDELFEAWDARPPGITILGWSADYVAPSNFIALYTCTGEGGTSYCDPDFQAQFDHALELQSTDPEAALREWAALDRRAVDLALLAPLYNAGADFVSSRVGNYQYSAAFGPLFDQMWVQ